VPRDWIAAPEYETAGGELLDSDEEDELGDDVESQLGGAGDDCRGIVRTEWSRRRRMGQSASDLEDNNDFVLQGEGHVVIRHEPKAKSSTEGEGTKGDDDEAWSVAGGKRIVSPRADDLPPARIVALKDNGGRDLPVAERAPVPVRRV
jgi:hypothetical protein